LRELVAPTCRLERWVTCFNRTRTLTPNLARYERIAPFYDLLDLPFERRRYHALRPLLFQNLKGRLLDAAFALERAIGFDGSAARQ